MIEPQARLAAGRAALDAVLERARALGFLGKAPIDDHVAHAIGFAAAWATSRPGTDEGDGPGRVLDLGSGGGLPGLVLSILWPSAECWLLDANERRTHFLRTVATEPPWHGRVDVLEGRAETIAHDPRWRGTFDAVMSRAFGPPSAVAECGAPFLVGGGLLVVSEPPGSSGARWPTSGLSAVGLGPAELVMVDGRTWAVMAQSTPTPEQYPRRVGLPTKRPLFDPPPSS